MRIHKITIEDIIKCQQENMRRRDIMQKYGVSGQWINKILKQNGYKTQNELKNTVDFYQKVYDLYTLYHCTKKVSENIGISQAFTIKILTKKEHPLFIQNKTGNPNLSRRKHKINYQYFDNIDTENKAYYLGFIFADGTVNNTRLKIAIHKEDFHILNNFIEDVFYDPNIVKTYEYETMRELVVGSKYLVMSLYKLGCIPNKTFKLDFPNTSQVPDHLIHHFIRGYFDGDGCAAFKHGKLDKVLFSGCRKFLISMEEIFHNTVGLSRRPMYDLNKNPLSATLSYQGNEDISKLFNFLYKDSTVFLSRKYSRILQHFDTLPKKTSDDILVETYRQYPSILKVSKITGIPVSTIYNRLNKTAPEILIHRQRKQKG